VLTAMLVGLVVGMLQAVTQIQDQSISFAVKQIAITVVLTLTARWFGGELYQFADALLRGVPTLGRK
jgi:type III secretion protein S